MSRKKRVIRRFFPESSPRIRKRLEHRAGLERDCHGPSEGMRSVTVRYSAVMENPAGTHQLSLLTSWENLISPYIPGKWEWG